MNQKKYFKRYKNQLIKIIEEEFPDCKIYLFGSRAVGNFSSGSDIDLALDNSEKIKFKIILKIHNKIEETSIPLGIDLVDFNLIDEDFKEAILKERVIWKS